MGGESIQEEMAVIWHDFQRHDTTVQVLGDVADDLFQPLSHLADQHSPSVPRTENEVVVDQRDWGCRTPVLLSHRKSIPWLFEPWNPERASSHP